MYMGLSAVMIFMGLLVASFCGLARTWVPIPASFSLLCFFFGFVLAFAGLMILFIRIHKLGLNWLIAPGRPWIQLWFYIYKDGEVRVTPGIRLGEGLLYSPKLDATIPDVRTYSFGDHKIRFVPEAMGHACDLDMVQYVQILRHKRGWTNMRQARQGIFSKIKKKEIIPEATTKRMGIVPEHLKIQRPKVR